MKIKLIITFVVTIALLNSCAIFVYDNDDNEKAQNNTRDTVTVIYSRQNVNPLSAE